jgi:hypothetical protein
VAASGRGRAPERPQMQVGLQSTSSKIVGDFC